jgi:hypothetical protein
MIIDCKVKDFDKHPSFTKWFNEMDAWSTENNIATSRIKFEVKESPYSVYNIAFSISYLSDTAEVFKIIEENYYLDRTEVEKILERFKQIDVGYFRIRVLDHIAYQKSISAAQ